MLDPNEQEVQEMWTRVQASFANVNARTLHVFETRDLTQEQFEHICDAYAKAYVGYLRAKAIAVKP
jgi:hypothetical protein